MLQKAGEESTSSCDNFTFESARSGSPADCALMKQLPPALREVFPPKDTTVFEFPVCLWLHPVAYFSQPQVLLVEINQHVHLYDGVFNQTQCPS